MKRILAITLTLTMVLTVLSGCMTSKNPSGDAQADSETVKCIAEENGKYTLTLPKSGEKIELEEEHGRFVPYITDALVESAEDKIAQEITEYTNHSGFYLQITEDYLCLTVEVIENIISPTASDTSGDESVQSGCGNDHEHIFYSERISTRALQKEETASNVIYESGSGKTSARSCLAWSHIYEDAEAGFDKAEKADYSGIAGILPGEDELTEPDVPRLVLDGTISAFVPVNGKITDVSLIDMTDRKNYPRTKTSFEALSRMEPGSYYVIVTVLLSGNCDSASPQNEYCYEDLFCLVVGASTGEQDNSANKDQPTGYPYRAKRIWEWNHPDGVERTVPFSLTIPELHNALIEYREDYKIYVDGEYLLGGAGAFCASFYLGDLTGDGLPELCFCMNVGSGIVDSRIEIFDYATRKSIFSLSDRMNHDYCLFVRNGNLYVMETEWMYQEGVRTGMLIYDGSELSVFWNSEVNTNADREETPTAGRPLS